MVPQPDGQEIQRDDEHRLAQRVPLDDGVKQVPIPAVARLLKGQHRLQKAENQDRLTRD